MIRSLGHALSALRQVMANPDIRRAELAWMLGYASEWAWLVALWVYAYNQSGAVNLTPLNITNFRAGGELKITTYDITGPGPGGTGGAQFTCPTATATQSGTGITAITTPAVPGATVIDNRLYQSLG